MAGFPQGKDGTRSLLPKQAEFMSKILDPKGPKYTLFMSGIGAGKTKVGCLTMIAMAIQTKGDYLITRQFSPELRDTTYKEFLEICPKELIAEHRVADAIVRLKCTGGGVSNILFRPAEEPDKWRSLSLSGFYIDEASQVSEAAFLLLQGRLRGPGLRKGFMTSNPNGHDWLYQWFSKQDHFRDDKTKRDFAMVRSTSLENTHLPDGYVAGMMATWSPERIKREIEGSFDAFEGMVYHEFRRDVHVVQPFVIPKEWTRVIGIDHGFRNPSAWVWGAVDYDDNIYIYREFYEREWLIEEIIKGKDGKPGVLQLMRGEKIDQARIDPSVRAVRGQTGQSDWDIYIEHLPKDFPLLPANNEKTAGIDKVKTYLKVSSKTNKPRVFIFSNCYNLIDEFSKYRYKELTTNQKGKQAEKEEPMKVDDHALDAFRYLIMSRPDAPNEEDNVYNRIKYSSIEGHLYRSLQAVKRPKSGDPFGDY